MEKPQIGILKAPLHRKSHLQSETYRALVRILSQCCKHPELCVPNRLAPQELRPDNHCNELVEASEKDGPEQIELVNRHDMDHNNSLIQNSVSVDKNFDSVAFQDSGFSDTQAVINEIENFMRIEEDEDPSKQEVQNDANGTGLQDQGFGQLQQLLMDELEHVMKGDEEVVGHKNCNSATTSLDENQSGEVVALSSNQEEKLDLQSIVEECRSGGQQEVDEGNAMQNTHETIDSSLGKTITGDFSKLSDNEDKNSLLRTNELGTNNEMQQKEMESGKSICLSGVVDSSNHIIEDGQIEEGEISGELEVNERLIDVFPEEVAMSQEQEKQLSEDNIGQNEFPCNDIDKKKETEKDFGSVSITLDMVDNSTDRREVEAKEFRNEMVHKRKIVVYGDPLLAEEQDGCENKKQKKGCETKEPKKCSRAKEKKKSNVGCPVVSSNNFALSVKKSDQDASGSQGITLKDKPQQDAGVSNKRKRGPLSEEKKAKKKEKKRKKRAEKNRELGVKRLKLRPVQNPKPVTHCRHYIKGRCHEGEKCKFSHDAIPLTKSKPCCHFARHSCLKGDACPFDHQLSKYPCTNYVTTGSCSRGQDCMFSHKLPLKEDLPSTSNVCTPDMKPQSLQGTSNSKKQLDSGGTSHQTTKASPEILGTLSCKNTEQNVDKSILSSPVLVPKGISFFSAGKSSVIESSHSTPGGSSMTRSEGVKAGSQTDQSVSSTIPTSGEIVKGTPATVTPKGINFLSFGKAPLEFSSTKKLASNSDNLSLSNNFSMLKQSTSPLNVGNSIQTGKETSQSVSNTNPWLNKMLQKTEFAAATLKSNVLSFGEPSTGGSRSTSQGSFPSSSTLFTDRSIKASEIALDKRGNSSAISQGQTVSLLGSGQSANYLAHACLKNTPNSAQKALMSTLAFAAKIGSEMKMKQSPVDALAVSSRFDKETHTTGGSQNDSAKASKILDFLSSVGGKMKQ